MLSEGSKNPKRQEKNGRQSPGAGNKKLGPEKEQKQSHIGPTLSVKDDLIVFNSWLALFIQVYLLEAKTLCDMYWVSVHQDLSWLNVPQCNCVSYSLKKGICYFLS